MSEPWLCRKKVYPKAGGAEHSAAAMARHGKASQHISVYWCSSCNGYHWGNAFGKSVPFLPQPHLVAKLSD
jgi:hypothetical protein